jgi:hypothetical protein
LHQLKTAITAALAKLNPPELPALPAYALPPETAARDLATATGA